MRHSKDHHPHHAGHRHAGIKVGENAKRSGPQPGQTEFSANEEKAMRAANSGMSANGGASAPPAAAAQDQSVPPPQDIDDGAPDADDSAPPAGGSSAPPVLTDDAM